MSTVIQPRPLKALPHTPKNSLQAKPAAKPQPTGLSREEIRQIVIDMIG
ncbi:hypothetical protein [Microvirga sp. 2TAF3]